MNFTEGVRPGSPTDYQVQAFRYAHCAHNIEMVLTISIVVNGDMNLVQM